MALRRIPLNYWKTNLSFFLNRIYFNKKKINPPQLKWNSLIAMANNHTIFQNLSNVFSGKWGSTSTPHVNSYDMSNADKDVIYRTNSKKDYDSKKLELQQNKYLKDRWIRANVDLSVSAYSGLNNVKLMYRDADLMDAFPEIGAALDIVAEESTITSSKGMIVNVYSKSDRIKSILEDLFVNRLNLQVTAPMIIRATCKYGNQFMLLDIDRKLGVKGWKQLPVFNVERIENGLTNPYGNGMSTVASTVSDTSKIDTSTKFVWVDESNSQVPFRNWQIAHFRLLTNSLYLPYGVSYLNAARRHWRMLSLMEDMMLIYRLERSIERRVYKIYVGAIDDADVQAYVENIANNFKRTPIVDPMTGQIDLRKNILSVDQDIFIPVRDQNAPTPIDTLQSAQNLTAMDDIKFVQNKVCTALRIPKTFLNFEDTQGDGKNLALQDIRFTRTVNRIQQTFLMELTKVASIHLYLLGFTDDLTNFSLTMNNPSTQAEQLEIDNLQKKISAARDAISDPGNGIPVMSQTRALKEIMKWSDSEIKDNLEEIRLERGIATELEKTSQIIKRTGIFDMVDRMYGEPGAEYQDGQETDQGGGMNNGGLGDLGGGGGDFGMGLEDLGAPESSDMGDIIGDEGAEPTSDMNGGGEGGEEANPMEVANRKKPFLNDDERKKYKKLIKESESKTDLLFSQYLKRLDEGKDEKRKETSIEKADIYDKSLLINEEFNKMIKGLEDKIGEGE